MTVQQVLTSLQLVQTTPVLIAGSSYQFAATGIDQFGQPIAAPPAVVWSADPGPVGQTMDPGGLFTTPSTAQGVATVRAVSGTVQGSWLVIVSTMGIFAASQDIGGPSHPGSMIYDSATGVYTVSGGGWDIWNNSDQFHFVYTPLTGDTALIARVTGVAQTDPWAKAGVMLRASADPDAMFVDMLITPQNVSFQWRSTTGGPCDTYTVWGSTAPSG